MVKDQVFRVTAADATTATLAPLTSKEHVTSTQIVLTFAATPPEFTVGKPVRLRLEVS